MRASVIAWSAFSGVLLGVFVDVLLVGTWILMGAIAPATMARLPIRLSHPLFIALLLAIPLAGAVLGYLEGRLKS